VGRVVGGWTRRRAARRADARLRSELPAAIDLVAVAMGAGTPPQAALELSARWAPPQVGARLRNVLVATRLGGSLPDALEEMHRTAPALAGLAEVLVAGARLGSPSVEALGRLSAEVRADERRRLEARVRVLPVKLLFPLVFLVLPAFGLLTVVPALLSALAHL